MEESQTILAELFDLYSQITLVVDALDECDKKSRLGFIDVLNKLIVQSSTPVKILISSRRDRDLVHRFEDRFHQDVRAIKIRAIDAQDDIAMFVNHEVTDREELWQCEMSPELKELICVTLVERSQGM